MLKPLKNVWQDFLLAVGFFTRIPVPSHADFQESDLNRSVKYFPLVGCIVGLIGVAAFYLAMQVFTHPIAVLISMAATIFVTGAFHEDGLADSADGLGGGWGREQVLAIMQDSRLGTYGAIALFIALMAKYQLLAAMHADTVIAVLICAHALSRLSAVWLMAALPYTKSSGKAKPLATEVSRVDLWIANIFGLLPLLTLLALLQNSLGNWRATLSLFLFLLGTISAVWWWWRMLLKRKLGGYTGDTLGAIQQLSEIMFYLASLAWLQFINNYTL
ncbi:MAG TPA: adenosylcobinamide-GDP ribazoletransferase [Methylotenera sp.]|nr:adenosylcobinamide-GDP ribazoletransferase [Methylotenera sp.]